MGQMDIVSKKLDKKPIETAGWGQGGTFGGVQQEQKETRNFQGAGTQRGGTVTPLQGGRRLKQCQKLKMVMGTTASNRAPLEPKVGGRAPPVNCHKGPLTQTGVKKKKKGNHQRGGGFWKQRQRWCFLEKGGGGS